MNNWLAVALSALLVVGASTHVLPTGRTHLYEYKTLVETTGDIGDQSAVHVIESVIEVEAKRDDILSFQFKRVKVGKANEVFTDKDPNDIPVSENEHYEDLRKPFVVEFKPDGIVKFLRVQESDSDWSINYKKALVNNMFQIVKLDHVIDAENHPSSRDNEEIGVVAEVMEPSLSGMCKSIYDFRTEITESSKPNRLFVTKIKDFRDCEEAPYFAMSTHRRFKCVDCEAEMSHPFSRNSMCKYEGDLVDDKEVLIKDIECNGIMKYDPFGQNGVSITVSHNQTLHLLRQSASASGRSRDSSPREGNLVEEEPISNLFDKLKNIRNPKDLRVPIIFEEICQSKHCESKHEEARRLIKEIASLIDRDDVDSAKKILDLTILIPRALFTVPLDKLEVMANEFSSQSRKDTTERKVFLDAVALTATNPCILLCLNLYQKGLISPDEMINILATIATHVMNPNTLLMDKMSQFIQSKEVQEVEQVAITAYLSFGSMVAQTCGDDEYEIPKTPEIFCPAESKRKYVKVLEELLDRSDRSDILHQSALCAALGNTGLKEAFPRLEQYIRSSDDIDDIIQVRAIFAITSIAKAHPELVRSPLISVLFNSKETTEARIAAVNVLIASRPDRHLYEKMAVLCQTEDDNNVCAYIYSTFVDYANTTNPCLAAVSAHAKHALSLMEEDDYDTSAWMGSLTILEGLMENVDAASFIKTTFLGDADSLIPTMMSMQFNGLMNDFTSNIATFTAHLKNPSFLFDSLFGSKFIFGSESFLQQLESFGESPMKSDVHDDLEKVGYQTRNQPEFEAIFYTRFMDFQQRMRNIDHKSIQKIAKYFERFVDSRKIDVDIQKLMMPVDVSMLIPCEAGFIVDVVAQTPLHMSIKAKTQIPEFSQRKAVFDFHVKPRIAMRVSVKAGICVPAEAKLIAAGYDSSLIVAPIIDGKVEFELTKSNAIISFKPNTQQSSDYKVLHYCIRPYTMIEPYWEFKPIQEISKEVHITKPHEYVLPLFENSISLRVKHEHEVDEDESLAKLFKEDNTILGGLTFWWLNDEFTSHEYEVMMKRSNLRELRYEMDWTYQPDDSQPNKHIKNFGYMLWNHFFAPIVPLDCEYKSLDSQSGEDYSDENSSDERKSWYGKSSSDRRHRPTTRPTRFDSSKFDEESREDDSREFETSYKSSFRRGHSTSSPREDYFSHRTSSEEDRRPSFRDIHDLKIHSSKIRSGASVLKINAKATLRTEAERGYKVNFHMERRPRDLNTRTKITVEPIGRVSQKMFCLDANHFGERPPCFFGHHSPNMRDANVTLDAEFKWGPECSRPDGEIKLKVVAKKSSEQLKVDSADRPWFYDQCRDDVADQNPMSEACMQKIDHLALLNSIKASLRFKGISPYMVNTASMAKNYLIYKFYPHLSHDVTLRNEQNELKFDLKFHYGIPALDLAILTPTEKLHFDKIYYGDQIPFFDAPSVAKTTVERVLEHYSDSDVTPTCTITDRYVNTFNNDTYELRPQDGCDYILAADPCPKQHFSILLRNNTRGSSRDKTLTVKLSSNVFEINPSEHVPVKMNDRPLPVEDSTITHVTMEESKTGLLGHIVRHGKFFQLTFPFHRLVIHFDGKSVKLYTSHLWRKKMNGICGERNSDDDESFVGPKKSIYTEGSDFANSYMIPSSECRKPELFGDVIRNMDVTYRHHARSGQACYSDRPLVKKIGNEKICISVGEHKLCGSDCSPYGSTSKRVDFHCISQSDPRAKEIYKSIGTDTWKPFADETVNYSAFVDLPESCRPRNPRHMH